MKNIIEEIEKTPELIKQSELKIMALKNTAANIKEQMDTIRRTTACEVASETIEGKKTFSNSETRDAETEKRLEHSLKYQELKKAFTQAETEKSKEEINLDYIKDMYSTNRYRVRLYTADKMERAANNFYRGVHLLAGLSDLLAPRFRTTKSETCDIPPDCPF